MPQQLLRNLTNVGRRHLPTSVNWLLLVCRHTRAPNDQLPQEGRKIPLPLQAGCNVQESTQALACVTSHNHIATSATTTLQHALSCLATAQIYRAPPVRKRSFRQKDVGLGNRPQLLILRRGTTRCQRDNQWNRTQGASISAQLPSPGCSDDTQPTTVPSPASPEYTWRTV